MDKVVEINNAGVQHFLNKRWEKAEEEYRKALEFDADNPTTLNNLGMLFHQKKQYAEAEKVFSKAIGVNAKSTYLVNLANAQVYLEKWSEAEQNYLRALQDDPKNRNAAVSLARFYEVQKKYWQAAEIWESLAYAPNDNEARFGLAKIKMALNRFEEAVAVLLELQETVDSFAISLQLGICELALKNYGLAEAAFRRALAFEPDNLVARHYLAVNYLAKNEYREALKELDFLLKLDPGNTMFSLDKASVLLAMKQNNGAAELVDKVLEREPANKKARAYHELLYKNREGRS